jgi:hypothetical protein
MKQSIVPAAALAGALMVSSQGALAEAGVAPPANPCAATTLAFAPPENAVIPINVPALPMRMQSVYSQYRNAWSVAVGDFVGPGGRGVYHVDSKENDVTLVGPIGPTEGEHTLSVSTTCQDETQDFERHFSFGPEVAYPKTIGTLTRQADTYAEIALTDEAFAFLPVTKVWVEAAGYPLTADSFYGELPADVSLYDHVLVVRAPEVLWKVCAAPGKTTFKAELHFDIAGTTDDPAPLEETIVYDCPAESVPQSVGSQTTQMPDGGFGPNNGYVPDVVEPATPHGCGCIVVGREASTGAAAASIAIGALALARRRRRRS